MPSVECGKTLYGVHIYLSIVMRKIELNCMLETVTEAWYDIFKTLRLIRAADVLENLQ